MPISIAARASATASDIHSSTVGMGSLAVQPRLFVVELGLDSAEDFVADDALVAEADEHLAFGGDGLALHLLAGLAGHRRGVEVCGDGGAVGGPELSAEVGDALVVSRADPLEALPP